MSEKAKKGAKIGGPALAAALLTVAIRSKYRDEGDRMTNIANRGTHYWSGEPMRTRGNSSNFQRVKMSGIVNKDRARAKLAAVKTADPMMLAAFGGANPLSNLAASTGTMGIQQGLRDPLSTWSHRLNRQVNPLPYRIKADELISERLVGDLTSSAAKGITGLLSDIVSKGRQLSKDNEMSAQRRMIFNALREEDHILSEAPEEVLREAYHTMSRFAPGLSTDKNAVKSFLRTAAMSEGGLDYRMIQGIAEAETSLNKAVAPVKTASLATALSRMEKTAGRSEDMSLPVSMGKIAAASLVSYLEHQRIADGIQAYKELARG